MHRRRYLALSSGTLAALAGCSGGSDGSDGAESTAETETDLQPTTDAPTPNQTATEGPKTLSSHQFEGTGDGSTDSFEVLGALVTLAVEHTGDGQFRLTAVSSNEETERSFIDHSGAFQGELPVPLEAGEWHLQIVADGEWRVSVAERQFTEADLQPLPIEGGGDGQYADWFGPIAFEGTTEISFQITDESTARVWLANDTGVQVEQLHSTTGPYEETVEATQEGYGIIVVGGSSPNWSITIGES
jgi:hypothetical protein